MKMNNNELKYPRPCMRRNSFINLNGKWNFYLDDKRIFERDLRHNVFPKDHIKINVPFCYQSQLSLVNKKEHFDTIYYQRNVTFKYNENERVIFHIDGSDYHTRVYVNSRFVGEHKGGYTAFSFDITDFLLDGKANIVIRCDDTYDIHQPRGKQKWRNEPFECFYQEVNGIWKSVWAEIVPTNYIKYLKLTANRNNSVDVEVFANSEKFTGEIQIDFAYKGTFEGTKTIKFKNGIAKDNIPLKNIYFWDLKKPNLYDVYLRLIDNGEVKDIVNSYFGYRFIEAKNRKFYLNDKEIKMKLTLEQSYYPEGIYTPKNVSTFVKEIKLIKKTGFNGLRLHQKVEDDRFYFICDCLGLIVWSEMPSCYDFDEDSKTNIYREWNEIIKEHYNHPSIMVWTPFNESWGINGIRFNKETQDFVNSIYDCTKNFDKTRLVVGNDGWIHCKTDIVTLHNYNQDPEIFNYYCKNCLNIVKNNKKINNTKDSFVPFANGYHYENQPIMMDEFAGIGFNIEEIKNGWGYGNSPKSEEEFYDRYGKMVASVNKAKNMAGWCMTQFSDIYQEVNGLYTFDRIAKFDIKKLRKIHGK